MSRFESIHISGFRRLIDVNFPLRPLMVMVGANGCGKTSVLDVWQLLASASDGHLRKTLSKMGGLSDLLTRGSADALSLQLSQFVERLEFPPVAAGMAALAWKDKNFSKSFYIDQLSEGTLRFLWLATLLQSRTMPAVTLVDEPEVSLHPELLGILVGLMREASLRTQLIVATHSDRLIGFLRPEEVLVVDFGDDGGSQFRWGSELDLEHWLDEYSLTDLWGMGVLGGRAT